MKIHPELKVQIDGKVYQDVIDHLSGNNKIELCGVLVGDVCKDENERQVLILDGSIRGENAESGSAEVKFTHNTWEYIFNELDKNFPGKKIMGWYHSHPGFGVFLSEMDLFIHHNFFCLPTQVALVVDPKSNECGLFTYHEGKVQRQEFWVENRVYPLSQEGKKYYFKEDIKDDDFIKVEQNSSNEKVSGKNNFKYKLYVFLILAFFSFLCLNYFK